jgi:magnesium-protoporphyrin IX monomethyl ester (oxidative) cyclase
MRLEQCAVAHQKLTEISNRPRFGILKFWQKPPWIVVILWQLLRLYLLPTVNAEASRTVIQ